MRAFKHEQGTQAWLLSRLGCPSASNFHKLITPVGKPSTSSNSYVCELVSQIYTKELPETFSNEWMERGNELEPKARQYYEMARGVEVQEIGFCKHDTLECGASPDGLVNDNGGLEIKCPAPATHCQYLIDGVLPSKYVPQVMGCLWITGRDWWDFVSYHETMPALLVRVERDEDYIAKLADEVEKACKKIEQCAEQIRKMQ